MRGGAQIAPKDCSPGTNVCMNESKEGYDAIKEGTLGGRSLNIRIAMTTL